MIELPPPEPAAWLEIDEDQLGRPVYKTVHQVASDILGEHRRAGVYTADQLRAYGRLCAEMQRERDASIAENSHPTDWAFIARFIRNQSPSGSKD